MNSSGWLLKILDEEYQVHHKDMEELKQEAEIKRRESVAQMQQLELNPELQSSKPTPSREPSWSPWRFRPAFWVEDPLIEPLTLKGTINPKALTP